ncbi:MAG: NADH-quinone oxidoreductase subunit J [Deltaproteobacteria bacterium]|nr:NADH-quinone oxidoreductase subunit J [Deltaproteobacteria bacterium]
MEQLFFIGFAFMAVVAAVGVISLRNPVHGALSLIVCLLQVAAIFVLLRSPFLAVVQVFIYVGAVMVLFLFAVMVVDLRRVELESPFNARGIFAYILAPIAVIEIFAVIFVSKSFDAFTTVATLPTKIETLARVLFTEYLFPFEIVSVLLLVAMVAAIVMTLKKGRS